MIPIARRLGAQICPSSRGDLSLLQDPIAEELLASKIPARLAYIATDGTPRVVPIWFHWDGRELVLGTPPKAPKLKSLAKNPKVAITIDDEHFPHKVLLIRGSARMTAVDGIVPEYAAAAERYFGKERGQAWLKQLQGMVPGMVRIGITPEWVGILGFQNTIPQRASRVGDPSEQLSWKLSCAFQKSDCKSIKIGQFSTMQQAAKRGPRHFDTFYVHTYNVLMNLTLSVDEQLVAQARKRANALGKSLNQLIRDYLQTLAGGDNPERSIDEFRKLSGKGDSRGWRFNRDEIHERS